MKTTTKPTARTAPSTTTTMSKQLSAAAKPSSPTRPPKLFPKPNESKSLQEYINIMRELDQDLPQTSEYGSILILGLMEEIGEIARAYLAEHGRKPTNKAAQQDETYKQELGDLLISIMRLAIHKNINLDHRIQYTMKKIQRRKQQPKEYRVLKD